MNANTQALVQEFIQKTKEINPLVQAMIDKINELEEIAKQIDVLSKDELDLVIESLNNNEHYIKSTQLFGELHETMSSN